MPWLQVKILRLLQYYPSRKNFLFILAQAPEVLNVLDKIIKTILTNASLTHINYNQGNAVNSVLFEAINYAIHLDPQSPFITGAGKILGSFINGKEANLKYLALETMAHIAATGDPLQTLGSYQQQVITSLQDKDISIRRRALDLLYSMCNESNYRSIVAELLAYLTTDIDYEFQEELVLKIAILAEKFVSEYTWYVDVILKLITTAGDAVSDSLWHRVVQIVTNHPDLREYAAYTILQAVKEPTCSEVTISIAGHILGEFGHIIVDSPGCSPIEQFLALHAKLGFFSQGTKAILLSTYLKFVNLFPEIKHEIVKVFESYQYVLDVELQQRACEYLAIIKHHSNILLPTVCEEMPPFIERESSLLSILNSKLQDTEDVRTWTIGGADAQGTLKERNKIISHSKPIDESELYKASNAQTGGADSVFVEKPASIEAPSQAVIDELYSNLLLGSQGVLYEDQNLQVGAKMEFQNNQGRIAIFFGNKVSYSLTDFISNISGNTDLNVYILQDVSTTIPSGTQLHIMVAVEALNIPTSPPLLSISYTLERRKQSLSLKIPVSLTKFIGACTLDAASYLSRWKQIGGPPKEAQAVCTPVSGINAGALKNKATGLGLTVLEGIDPNPDNFILAGIFESKNIGKVGCLVRVECNKELQVTVSQY
jgi:AP-2 complex subunit alpha